MTRILALLAALAFVGAAQAQIKCWKDAKGRHVCGDTPPAGATVSTIKVQPAPAAAPAAAGAAAPPGSPGATGPAARKGPLTPAEKEQEYRKRKLEEQEAAEKQAKERQELAAKRENCANAQESLRAIGSGQRILRVNAQGERYYLNDEQIAQEKARAQELVRQSCN